MCGVAPRILTNWGDIQDGRASEEQKTEVVSKTDMSEIGMSGRRKAKTRTDRTMWYETRERHGVWFVVSSNATEKFISDELEPSAC